MAISTVPLSWVVICDHKRPTNDPAVFLACPSMLLMPYNASASGELVAHRRNWETTLDGRHLCQAHKTPLGRKADQDRRRLGRQLAPQTVEDWRTFWADDLVESRGMPRS